MGCCQTMADEVVNLLRDKKGTTAGLNRSADQARRQMDWETALELCEQSLQLCSNTTSLDAVECQAVVQMYLGAVYHSMGDLDQAATCYRQSADTFSFIEDPDCRWNEAVAYYGLGLLAQARGYLAEAQQHYHQGLDLFQCLKGKDAKEVDRFKHRICERIECLKSLCQQRERGEQQDSSVPILGKTAAGVPILAIEVTPDDVSSDSIRLGDRDCIIKKAWEKGKSGNFELKPGNAYFALAVKGNSMIEKEINNGDYVIFKHQPVAEQGEIVVVRIDEPGESESTVKKYYKHGTTIRLKAANPQYYPQEHIFKASDPTTTIVILGKAVAVASFQPLPPGV